MTQNASRIAEILHKSERDLLSRWLTSQAATNSNSKRALMKPDELEADSREFLRLFTQALHDGRDGDDTASQQWISVRDFLSGVSATRAKLGFASSETARF